MKIVFNKIHSFVPTLELRINSHGFYKGLTFAVIVWRKGVSVTFTTRHIYGAYMRELFERAKRHQKELR